MLQVQACRVFTECDGQVAIGLLLTLSSSSLIVADPSPQPEVWSAADFADLAPLMVDLWAPLQNVPWVPRWCEAELHGYLHQIGE